MKKIITILLACSNSSNGLVNGNEVIFKGPDMTFTKNDLYNALKAGNYSNLLITNLIETVATKENLDMSKYETQAEETMEMYKQIYGLNNFDDYGGDDQFKKQLVVDAIITDKANAYIENNISTYISEDKPIKAQLAYFDEKEKADAVVEAVSKGSTFDMSVLENGYNNNAQEQIYLIGDETLPAEVKEYINTSTNKGLSPVLLTTETSTDSDGKEVQTPKYYLINITSRDYNEFKEDYISLKSTEVEDTTIFKEMFKNYDIKFYDQEAFNLINESYPGVFE